MSKWIVNNYNTHNEERDFGKYNNHKTNQFKSIYFLRLFNIFRLFKSRNILEL